jgi:hypothetical protein
MKMSGLCLVALMSVVAFGFAGSASAKVLLFKPEGSGFPFHLAGTGGASKLVQDGGSTILSSAVHALAIILETGLIHARLTFLNSHSPGVGECHSGTDSEGTILINLLGHLGLTHPNDLPAVLLLVPTGFSFTCGKGLVTVDVRGSVIGLITKPNLLTKSKELTLSFKQTNGVQEHTQFLLGNALLTGQDLQSVVLPLSSTFLLSGQEAEATLKATAGEFQLVDE